MIKTPIISDQFYYLSTKYIYKPSLYAPMALRHMAQKRYVMLRADLSVHEGLARINRLKPNYVIVHRTDYRDLYYLFSTFEIQQLLLRKSDIQMPLYKALDLHERDRTPTFNPSITIPIDKLPSKAIVVEDANVVGVIDRGPRNLAIPMRGGSDQQRGGGGQFGGGPPPRQLGGRGADIGGKATGTEELTSFYLSANFPAEVRLGDSVSLLISISTKSAEGKAIPFAVPENTKIDIVVEPQEGFVVDERAEGSLIATKQDTLPLQFKLRAIQLGIGKIRVIAFQDGQALGSITINTSVTAAGAEATAPQRQIYEADVARPTAAFPDLQLLITEGQTNGRPSLTFRLTATDYSLNLNLKAYGPVTLQTDPHDYFSKFFAEIESLPIGTPEERVEAESRVARKGSNLFKEVVPQDLQVLLWDLRDKIKSVYIQSEEPWIPWEICRLQGNENGRIREGKFLCEAFSVTRWIPGKGTWPKLTAKKMGLVVPSDSGLPYAKDEKNYLLSNKPSGCIMDDVPAQLDDVLETLAKGEHDIWHFTGHGGFRDRNPDYSGISLEQGKHLTPEDLSGEVENLGVAHPLVFLNACQVGRTSMSLTDIGGLAKKFVDARAAAFIGAYWSIYDEAAFEFSREVYRRLFAGTPIGRAVQEARLAIKPLGNPTWLAYTVFADPFATITTQ
jgi:CHAT domain/Ternary complex associated domain 7